MKYAFIAKWQQEYPVTTMCRVLEVSVSGYYAWRQRAEPPVSDNERMRGFHRASSRCIKRAIRSMGVDAFGQNWPHTVSRAGANEWCG